MQIESRNVNFGEVFNRYSNQKMNMKQRAVPSFHDVLLLTSILNIFDAKTNISSQTPPRTSASACDIQRQGPKNESIYISHP